MSHPETFRLHPSRREGNGSIQSPVVRFEQKCAVEDCPDFARTARITNAGFHVLYCTTHNRLAEAIFGA